MAKGKQTIAQPIVASVSLKPQPSSSHTTNNGVPQSIILPNPDTALTSATVLQKRRRVTRACDECRKKKVKCDGNLPCIHCTVYSHECTYDHQTNRNPARKKSNTKQIPGPALSTSSNTASNSEANKNPSSALLASGISPQVIQKMTNRLRLYDDVLKRLLPDIKLTDENDKPIPVNPVKLMAALTKLDEESASNGSHFDVSQASLIAKTYEELPNVPVPPLPSLPTTTSGNSNASFGSATATPPIPSAIPASLNSPGNLHTNSPSDDASSMGREIRIILPTREVALQLITKTWENACVLFRFYHRPAFIEDLNELYDTDPGSYTNKQQRFLPLVYSVMACGALFYKSDEHTNGHKVDDNQLDDAFKDEGYRYFIAARKLIDITDTRDTYGIQTIVMLIIFLQCSARLSTCYAYIGIALRAALREGLHRQLDYPFNPIELEIRKRLFWTIYKMDIYVNTMLGLPRTISEDDFDQEMPLELDDENITVETYRFDRQGDRLSSSGIANAHTRLIFLMKKIVTKLYPIKSTKMGASRPELLAHDIVYELELDLQDWMNSLPLELKPGVEPSSQYLKANRLLHISYLHVKIILYRPFIHYISADFSIRKNSSYDLKCIEKAKNCINVARIVVKLAEDMIRKNMLSGSYWFSIYTIFFSVACLVYYVHFAPPINRNGDYDPEYIAIKNDAENGKKVLDILKDSSQAARRTYNILNALFEQLNRRTARASINHDVEIQNPQFVTPQVGKSQLEKEVYVKTENTSRAGSSSESQQNQQYSHHHQQQQRQQQQQSQSQSQSQSQQPQPQLVANAPKVPDTPVDLSVFQTNYVPPATPKMDNKKINKIANGVNFIDGVYTGINLNVASDEMNPSSSTTSNYPYQGRDDTFNGANDENIDDKKYVPGIMDQLDMKIFGRFLPPYMLNSNHETTVQTRETSPAQNELNYEHVTSALDGINADSHNQSASTMKQSVSGNSVVNSGNNQIFSFPSMPQSQQSARTTNSDDNKTIINNGHNNGSSNNNNNNNSTKTITNTAMETTNSGNSKLNDGLFDNINAIPSGLSTVVQSSNHVYTNYNVPDSEMEDSGVKSPSEATDVGMNASESPINNNSNNNNANGFRPDNLNNPLRERFNSTHGYDFDEFFFNDWSIGDPNDFNTSNK